MTWQGIMKKMQKALTPGSGDTSSDDGKSIGAAVGSLHLTGDHQKHIEKQVKEQLARQREAEQEARRRELLEATAAVTPWMPKARPGDEMFPQLRVSGKAAPKQRHEKAAGPSAPTKSGKAAPATSSKKDPSASSDSSGIEPALNVDMDEDESLRASSLRMLLEDMAADSVRSVKEPSKKEKSPRTMTPAELVDLMRRDEESWKRLIRENTLIAVASSMPMDEDRKKAADGAKRSTSKRKVRFGDKVETVLLPVGQPYSPDEASKKQNAPLDLERTKK